MMTVTALCIVAVIVCISSFSNFVCFSLWWWQWQRSALWLSLCASHHIQILFTLVCDDDSDSALHCGCRLHLIISNSVYFSLWWWQWQRSALWLSLSACISSYSNFVYFSLWWWQWQRSALWLSLSASHHIQILSTLVCDDDSDSALHCGCRCLHLIIFKFCLL
jgi:hypothetical protein